MSEQVKKTARQQPDSFNHPVDYWGRITAGPSEIEYELSFKNMDDKPWPARSVMNLCVNPIGETGFTDSQLKRLYIYHDKWLNSLEILPGCQAKTGSPDTRLSPGGNKQYPRLERLIARVSHDGQWILATANDHGAMLAWNPAHSCIHCAPNYGPLNPGQTLTTRGKICLLKNVNLQDVFDRYKNDFGLLNPPAKAVGVTDRSKLHNADVQ